MKTCIKNHKMIIYKEETCPLCREYQINSNLIDNIKSSNLEIIRLKGMIKILEQEIKKYKNRTYFQLGGFNNYDNL